MNKLEHVKHWVRQIVKSNVPTWVISFPDTCNLSGMEFNTTSGRHELECFFGIDFEQEQVDAWTTVQNIIDDVMNLWIAPITDAATAPGSFYDQNGGRFKGQNHMSPKQERRYLSLGGESGPEVILPMRKDTVSNPRVQIEPKRNTFAVPTGHEAVRDADGRATGAVQPINRIERQDVDIFRSVIENDDCMMPHELNDYQRIATKSAIYPGKGTPFGLMYAALGLAEAGEVQNKVKKAFRDDGVISFQSVDQAFRGHRAKGEQSVVTFHPITPERRAQIIKELGGVLWYIAAVCDEIGATMSEVALQNLDELCGRGERNTLRGDGDNR